MYKYLFVKSSYLTQQDHGLIMRKNIQRPMYDFKVNPNKRTQREEDTTKVQFQHLELSFQIYLTCFVAILIPTFLAEISRAWFIKRVYYPYKVWDRKWKARHDFRKVSSV